MKRNVAGSGRHCYVGVSGRHIQCCAFSVQFGLPKFRAASGTFNPDH